VARRAKAKFVLGLSATVTRKDGHHPITLMQCGPGTFPCRCEVPGRGAPLRSPSRAARTPFMLPLGLEQERPPIQQIYGALAADEARNAMFFNDVLQALEDKAFAGNSDRAQNHALFLGERVSRFARNVIILTGGMGAKQRRAALQRLGDVSATDERVLIATGRYIGEGFDDARLDTLFLAMPISWKGTLAKLRSAATFHP